MSADYTSIAKHRMNDCYLLMHCNDLTSAAASSSKATGGTSSTATSSTGTLHHCTTMTSITLFTVT
jgi:hypothetical protein